MSEIEELPLDCWNIIILFLNELEDLFSLSLVEGLWDYIISTNAYSVRNIPFKLKILPSKIQYQVSYLMCNYWKESQQKSLDKFLEGTRWRKPDLTSFLVEIIRLFPNLLKIKFFITKRTKHPYFSRISSSFNSNRLSYLSLDLQYGSYLNIDSYFPSVEYVSIRSKSRYRNYHRLSLSSKAKVVINWKKFGSRLKVLKLRNLKVEETPFPQGRVVKMILKNVNLIHHSDISKSSNLTYLELVDTKISMVQELFDLRTLKIHFDRSSRVDCSKFHTFPSLETIEIHDSRYSVEHTKNNILCLKDSPNLKEATFKGFLFPIRIVNCPGLNRIYHEMGGKLFLAQGTNTRELTVVRCEGVSETLLPHLSFLSNLEEARIETREKIIHRTFELQGLKKLESLICKRVTFSSIRNCPGLKNLDALLTKDVVLSDLPKLKKLEIEGSEKLSDVGNIEELTIKHRSEMPVSVVAMHSLRKLKWIFQKSQNIEKEVSGKEAEKDVITVKQCQRLKELKIMCANINNDQDQKPPSYTSYRRNKKSLSNIRYFIPFPNFDVSEVPFLNSLSLETFHSVFDNPEKSLNGINRQIEELIISEIFCKIENGKKDVCCHPVISSDHFPNLKNLVLKCCSVPLYLRPQNQQEMVSQYYILESIRNLDKLEQIHVMGTKGNIPFLKSVYNDNMDLNSIALKWTDENEGEVSTCCFNNYVKNYNVKVLKVERTEKNSRRCNRCGKLAKKACSRCKKVYYCSRDCHVKDWKLHKKYCRKKERKN